MGECYYHGLSNPGCPECEDERRAERLKKAMEEGNTEPFDYMPSPSWDEVFPDFSGDKEE